MPIAKLAEAFAYAEDAHRGQTRTGTSIPYIAHPMAVSSLVMEHGGSEDGAVAALLHDVVEDQGGLPRARDIANAFGSHVAALVLACSDAALEPGQTKPPWLERKLAFVARAPDLPPEAALIVTCDKIHNLRALLRDLRRDGPSTLRRFSRPDALGWYYTALSGALRPFSGGAPVEELAALARALVAEAPTSGRSPRG